MSGEDPWNPGPWTSNFRVKCPECGKQVQFTGGLRAEPDCGHDLDFVRVEMDTRKANQARPRLALVSNRPDWCGECDEWTRLRDYDGTPYRCPTCHPLAKEAS